MSVVAIDFETANSRRDSACSVGLAFIEGRRVVRRDYRLIRPRDMDFHPMNIAIHGIRPRDVAGAPDFGAVFRDLLPKMEGALIVAHNASFDLGVLAGGLKAAGLSQPPLSSLCTVSLARRLWPGEKSYRLSSVAGRIGFDFRHHHAGEDALACAVIALEGVAQAGLPGIEALADALALRRDHQPVVHRPQRAAPPSGIVARALGAMTKARADATAATHFVVRGSKGTPYDVRLVFDREGAPSLKCSCIAGRYRNRCRHVSALMAGDAADLLSENRDQCRQLAALFARHAD